MATRYVDTGWTGEVTSDTLVVGACKKFTVENLDASINVYLATSPDVTPDGSGSEQVLLKPGRSVTLPGLRNDSLSLSVVAASGAPVVNVFVTEIW